MFISSQLYDRVKAVLTKHPETRDNDHLLMWEIWQGELVIHSLEGFRMMFVAGKLSDGKSIARYRQLCQEKHENLRGERWEKRHEHKEKTKSHLKELKVA